MNRTQLQFLLTIGELRVDLKKLRGLFCKTVEPKGYRDVLAIDQKSAPWIRSSVTRTGMRYEPLDQDLMVPRHPGPDLT
jgi:hypothetical protein